MADFTYTWTDRHEPLMCEQQWEAKNDLTRYGDVAAFEFPQFAEHLGTPKIVMDIGCGLGRGAVYLNYLLGGGVHFILADRHGRTGNSGAFNPVEDEYYNDLDLTADFCRLNGLTGFRTFDTEKDDWAGLPRVDLILSLCSLGMHVPIERYLDRMISISKPETVMIFGVRELCYRAPPFADRFQETVYIPGLESGNRFPSESWLVLKGPKDV